MRTKARAIAVISVIAGLLWHAGDAAPLAAQGQTSLAEVARQEQERRKNIKAPSKVLTNKDLAAPSGLGPAPAPAAGDAAAGTADASQASTASPDAGTTAAEPAQDQAYWSKRWNDVQGALSRNETFAVALQSRINALANEYTNQADGVRQAAIAAERQKTVGELGRVTKDIADGKKAIADLQEEARRSGVPPGWLR